MIKFFRKIRQRLLSEKKVSKYFLYAIGEILLVVIGILIALQVNNLNEQSKTRNLEQKYLFAIRSELNNNLDVINEERLTLTNSLDAQRKIIELIDSESDTIGEKQLSFIFSQAISQEVKLNYQNGVFIELLSSGALKDISNDSIKNLIASWEGNMIKVRNQENELESKRQAILDYITEFGDLRTIVDNDGSSKWAKVGISKRQNSNKPLLGFQTYENLIVIYLILGYVLDEMDYPELEENINLLLGLVETEIE